MVPACLFKLPARFSACILSGFYLANMTQNYIVSDIKLNFYVREQYISPPWTEKKKKNLTTSTTPSSPALHIHTISQCLIGQIEFPIPQPDHHRVATSYQNRSTLCFDVPPSISNGTNTQASLPNLKPPAVT